jgi:hypothetical protein
MVIETRTDIATTTSPGRRRQAGDRRLIAARIEGVVAGAALIGATASVLADVIRA